MLKFISKFLDVSHNSTFLIKEKKSTNKNYTKPGIYLYILIYALALSSLPFLFEIETNRHHLYIPFTCIIRKIRKILIRVEFAGTSKNCRSKFNVLFVGQVHLL